MSAESTVLREEFELFEQHKQEWLRTHLDEFVVVLGSQVVGFYPDYESGFKSGLSAAGLGHPFLLRQVSAEEPVYLIY